MTSRPRPPPLSPCLSSTSLRYPAAFGTSYWNTTCICPYVSASSSMATETHSTVCDDAAEGGDCALIGFGEGATEYSASSLEAMVDALGDASITIDSDTCPVYYESR